MKTDLNDRIAVIGYSCRFPGSPDIQTFWENLKNGVDCISTTEAECTEQNINRFGVFEGYTEFDPDFFSITGTEACMMDPQQRWMLELCTEALEHSGTVIDNNNTIGLYAGTEEFIYVWKNIFSSGSSFRDESFLHKSYLDGSLASRTAYLLNLTGPSITMKASCATSLYCIHYACQELQKGGCNIALAAGVNIHEYQEGYHPAQGTMSKRGVVSPFDEKADGFIPGNGIGVVVLKKMEDAVADKDEIYAVICGSAVCNDGRQKLGFTAPSVSGEYRAIKDALVNSGVHSSDIGYVETHGTATELGDTIEIKALSRALHTENRNTPLKIGSLKSNIGHLNAAAGVASFIKTVLMLYNRTLVPTINFDTPNPKLGMQGAKIEVCTETKAWKGERLVAGVSAFGIGGNNCHMILSSHERQEKSSSGELHIFPLSAKSKQSLVKQQKQLAEKCMNISTDSIAYTLQCCRKPYHVRTAVLASSADELSKALTKNKHFVALDENGFSDQVFMFAGAAAVEWKEVCVLYHSQKRLQRYFNECFDIINDLTGISLESYLHSDLIPELLENLLLFCMEYAMASYYIELGVLPDIVCGYSAGEYMAAYFAGIITLRQLFQLNISRIKAMEKVPESCMMTIMDHVENIRGMLFGSLEISAYNTENRIMVSGMKADIEAFARQLKEKNVMTFILPVKRAGHFSGVSKAAESLREQFAAVEWKTPSLRFISSGLGRFCEEAEICQGDYWIQQMVGPVKFDGVLKELNEMDSPKIIAFGTNAQLSRFYNQIKAKNQTSAICALPEHLSNISDRFTAGIADAWSIGLDINFYKMWNENPGKVGLPTRCFDNRSFIYALADETETQSTVSLSSVKRAVVNGLAPEMKELTSYFLETCKETVIIQKQSEYKKLPLLTEEESIIKDIEIKINEKYPECKTICEYAGLNEVYNKLCLSASAEFMKTFSVLNTVGEIVPFDDLKKRAAVSPEYYEMFRLMLMFLKDYGYIKAEQIETSEDKITLIKPLDDIPDMVRSIENCSEQFGAFRSYMELLQKCSDNYPGVLTGKLSGKSVIYPNGEYKLLDEVYSSIPVTTKTGVYAEILAKWLVQLVKKKQGKLKILEVGAGTGIITWLVMDALKGYEKEYYFTDIGKSFLETARGRAEEEGYSDMIFTQLDVTKSFEEQNVPHNYFDIVLSCNVIQAVSDMDNAVINMKQALNENGILALLQTVSGNRISEMIFGLCPEWWNYRRDEKRKDSPIINTSQWHALLVNNSYENVRIFNGDSTHHSDVAIIMGQAGKEQELSLTDDELINLCSLRKEGKYRLLLTESYEQEAIEAVRPSGFELYLPTSLRDEYKEKNLYSFCRNETDIKLVKLLYQITGVMVEDLTETLYGMAIDSLSALIICTKIGELFHIPFGIAKLLEFSCIEELSDYISNNVNSNITEKSNFEEEF